MGTLCPPFLSLCQPSLTPALCYLLQTTSKKSWIFVFSPLLGLLLQSVLSPFTGVSKSTALAGRACTGHRERLRVLPLPRAVVSGSS